MCKTFINIKRGDTIYFIDRYENIKKSIEYIKL